MARVGNWNTHSEPIGRRKGFANKSYTNTEAPSAAAIGVAEPGFDITEADLTGVSDDFVTKYNYLVPLFYQSFAEESGGQMKLGTPNNITTETIIAASYDIKRLGLCRLNEDKTQLQKLRQNDVMVLPDLWEAPPNNLQFFELGYNEILEAFQPILTTIANLQDVCYHGCFGIWELVSVDENNNYSITCAEIKNNFFFRR